MWFIENFTLLLLFVFTIGIVTQLLGLYGSAVFCGTRATVNLDWKAERPLLHILVPAFKETAIIESTYAHFREIGNQIPNCRVYIITSERDAPITAAGKTPSITSRLCREDSLVIHLHYPGKLGIMAHQVNWAIAQIRNLGGKVTENDVMILYNADSKTTAADIELLLGVLCSSKEEASAVQQLTLYPSPRTGRHPNIMSSAAVWQNRWTLCFELPRLLLVLLARCTLPEKRSRLVNLVLPFMYVIGHGLGMRFRTIQRLGGFPEAVLNEDAALGLLLYHARFVVRTIPRFEIAESPSDAVVYLKQQCSWFSGPSQAFVYCARWRKVFQNADTKFCRLDRPLNQIELAIASLKLFLHSVYWISGPILLLVIMPVVLIARQQIWQLAMWVCVSFLYLWVVPYLVVKVTNSLAGNKICDPVTFAGNIGAYFLHGLGACTNVFLTLIGRNRFEDKPKTARNDE